MADVFILQKLLPREGKIDLILSEIMGLASDKSWRIEIKEAKATRSEKQNNTLWWIYETILEVGGETMGGWEKSDLHEFFLCLHFGDEIREVFGKKRRVPRKRSSKLGKIEFAELVEHIYRFMAEQGVALPQPDPDYLLHREEADA
jgi:hypothetical protein